MNNEIFNDTDNPVFGGSKKRSRAVGKNQLLGHLIKELRVRAKERVLELDFGSHDSFSKIINRNSKVRYFGLHMVKEVVDNQKVLHYNYTIENRALFDVYDGESIPYVHKFFHKAYCLDVKRIQEDYKILLPELYRVLVEGGFLLLCLPVSQGSTDVVCHSKKIGFVEISKRALIVNKEKPKGDLDRETYVIYGLQKPIVKCTKKDKEVLEINIDRK